MKTKYFVDGGVYIGGFDGDDAIKLVPKSAIEVPAPPDHADQPWDGKRFGARPPVADVRTTLPDSDGTTVDELKRDLNALQAKLRAKFPQMFK